MYSTKFNFFTQENTPSELELQMEIERLVVKDFAVENHNVNNSAQRAEMEQLTRKSSNRKKKTKKNK